MTKTRATFPPFFLMMVFFCLFVGECPGVYGLTAQAPTPTPTPTTVVSEPLQCWVGTSNPKASSSTYPPELQNCTLRGGGTACSLTYIANLNVYTMACTFESQCQQDLKDFEAGTSFYDLVQCCTEDECNADPNMPSGASYNSPNSFTLLSVITILTGVVTTSTLH